MIRHLVIYALLSTVAFGACTVGTSGSCEVGAGKTYATISACISAMSAGQTCKVFAGTYAESPTITAGTVGNYNTVTINGSDVVNVTGGFTLNSHTKLSGIVFNHTGSCITLGSTATDVFIGPNNSLTQCGTIAINSGNSFIFVQGNSFSYAGCTPPNPGATCGRWFNVFGSNVLIENNDFSHYQLAIVYGGLSSVTKLIFRNNTFHDQLETEAGSNGHTDSIFSEPQTGATNVVIEGNIQRNAVGANAKGFLSQDDAGCATTTPACDQLIIRFNTTSRLGSGTITNDKTWPHVISYNNTEVDNNEDVATAFGISDNSISAASATFKNNLYYYTQGSISDFNPYACNNTNCEFGNNLYWCTGTCSNIHGHTYGGAAFLTDSGNKNANPLFVSYVGAGSASNDFHLQSGSPAKGAGTFLTTVSTSGSGTSLVVANAHYFQDGYGLQNSGSTVQGDCIAINTSSNRACITAVNYATNTLTLATSLTWTAGQPVYLYSKSDGVAVWNNGLASPDMGAFPTGTAPSAFTISGTVSTATGSSNPNPGVTISCPACTPTSTTTAADGTYSFLNQTAGGTYVLTPSASTYSFSPSNSTFTNLSANQSANFTATGTPTAGVSPTVLTFGSQGIGTTSAGQVTRLANNGTGQLTGISVSITGTNAGDFAQTNTCATTLNAGLQCAVTVTFTPTVAGTRTATVSFTDSLGTQTASLSGTGYLAPVPSCQPSGGSWKSGRLITCTNQVPAATMCWQMGVPPTTDGAGTCTSGNIYAGAFMVFQTGTLYVTGTQSGNIDSSVSYTHTLPNGPWTTGWVMNLPGGGNTRFGRIFGPPLFSGSTSSTAVATTPPLPNLASVNATGYAYSSPGDFYYPASGKGNCITALTDSTTKPGFGFHSSWSGGGGNVMYDVNRAFGSMTDNNNMLYFHVHYDANGCMQRDSDVATSSLSGGAGAGGLSFSRVTPGRVYRVDGGSHNPNGTDLYQEDLTYNSGTPFGTVSVARTLLFHWNNCPGVPGGTTVSQGGNGNLNVSYDDNIFSTSLNIKVSTGVPPSGQDNGHWVLAWNKSTGQCTTYYSGTLQNAENPQNGNIWTWCGPGDCSQAGSNPPPDFLNNTCLSLSAGAGYGIHDTAAAFQGQYIEISGKCDPNASSNNQSWKYGTNLLQNCSSATFNCGGHAPMGYSTTRQVNVGMTIRNVSDLSTWTTFRASVPPVDFHGGTNWFGATSDVNPWMASTQSSAVGGDCTGLYLCNEVVGFRLDGTIVRFAPNYYAWPAGALGHGLGPIPAMTQDGYCVVFESTWNGTRGSLANGDLRTDLFSICNLQ